MSAVSMQGSVTRLKWVFFGSLGAGICLYAQPVQLICFGMMLRLHERRGKISSKLAFPASQYTLALLLLLLYILARSAASLIYVLLMWLLYIYYLPFIDQFYDSISDFFCQCFLVKTWLNVTCRWCAIKYLELDVRKFLRNNKHWSTNKLCSSYPQVHDFYLYSHLFSTGRKHILISRPSSIVSDLHILVLSW